MPDRNDDCSSYTAFIPKRRYGCNLYRFICANTFFGAWHHLSPYGQPNFDAIWYIQYFLCAKCILLYGVSFFLLYSNPLMPAYWWNSKMHFSIHCINRLSVSSIPLPLKHMYLYETRFSFSRMAAENWRSYPSRQSELRVLCRLGIFDVVSPKYTPIIGASGWPERLDRSCTDFERI